MKIEAVMVCVEYADFLKYTLPEALNHLDKIVVVTTPEDKATQALCTKYGVDFVDTHVFFEDGDKFNKGRAINLGLSHLRHDGWLLHLDADILLPHGFRNRLAQAKLDTKNVYGCDRLNIKSYEQFEKVRNELHPQFQYRYLVVPHQDMSLGARLLHNEYGYAPIGFFQLWHNSAQRKYPINQGSAEHTDVLFSVQWDRERRIHLPEFFVFHLESEISKMGTNWKGRATKAFEKKSDPGATNSNPGSVEPAVNQIQKVQHRHLHHFKCPPWPPYCLK